MVVDWGEASRPLRDGTPNGDMCLVQPRRGGVLMAAMDALGHGPEAAATADVARAVIESDPEPSLPRLVQHCHEQLRRTRGVALNVAFLDGSAATLRWLGVGNIFGMLVRAPAARNGRDATLLLRTGIVGRMLPPIAEEVLPIAAGDRLIFATDGIGSDFWGDVRGNGSPQQQAEHILDRYYRGDDDALVMVAVFRGSRS